MPVDRQFSPRHGDRRRIPATPPLVLPSGIKIARERRTLERREPSRLTGLELFSDVAEEVVQSMLASCPIRDYASDTQVLSPNQHNSTIYVVLAGQLRVHLDAVDSTNFIAIPVGSCIGELSLIDGKPVTAHVIAEAGCSLLMIPEQHFWTSVLPRAGVARNLMRVLAERMRASNESILQGLRQQLRLEHIQRELQLAREIQAGMLPTQSSVQAAAEGIEICAAMEPAREVGGDLYDFFKMPDGKFCFLLGDVSDKGVPAALFMARTVDAVRIVSRLLRSHDGNALALEKIIECVNQELSQNNASCMFVTMFMAVFDPHLGVLHYCNAGHNNPYLLGAGGSLQILDGSKGVPLGISAKSLYASHSLMIGREELLFLFSDGITEAAAPNGAFFGEARLEAILRTATATAPRAAMDAVLAAVSTFVHGAAQSDDITALAVSLRPVSHDTSL